MNLIVLANEIQYLNTIFNTQFLVDVIDVVFNGMRRDIKGFLDIGIAHSIEYEIDDLLLAIGNFMNAVKIFQIGILEGTMDFNGVFF